MNDQGVKTGELPVSDGHVCGGSAANYWEKRLSEKWGLHGVGHVSYGRAYNKYLYHVRRGVFLRHTGCLPIRFRDATVLDVGSGTGFWVEVWKSLGVRSITASDITSFAVENLRVAHPGIKTIQFDISDSRKAEDMGEKYDLISAIDVMFHIISDRDFDRALANVAQLLKPSGFFIFSDNFVHKATARSSHQVSRTLAEVTRELACHRLRILKRVPMFVLMNTPVDTGSSFPKILWRVLMAPVKVLPPLGEIYGALLSPLELLLTKLLHESPSTELAICQKV